MEDAGRAGPPGRRESEPSAGSAVDDPEVILGIQRRDRSALEALYDRYSPRLYAAIARIVRQAEDAEEVLQDVWFEVWNRATEYCPRRGTVRAWLHTLARSRALDRYRSLRSRRRAEDGARAEAGLDSRRGTEESTPGLDQREEATTLLAVLPPPQRHILQVSYYEGLTQLEIAERLDLPLGTVKTWMRRGLDTLRETARARRVSASSGQFGSTSESSRGKKGPQTVQPRHDSTREGKRWFG